MTATTAPARPWLELDGGRIVLRNHRRENGSLPPALAHRYVPVAKLVADRGRYLGGVYEPMGPIGHQLVARIRKAGYVTIDGVTDLSSFGGGWAPTVAD